MLPKDEFAEKYGAGDSEESEAKNEKWFHWGCSMLRACFNGPASHPPARTRGSLPHQVEKPSSDQPVSLLVRSRTPEYVTPDVSQVRRDGVLISSLIKKAT